jgi:hypothetical protein
MIKINIYSWYSGPHIKEKKPIEESIPRVGVKGVNALKVVVTPRYAFVNSFEPDL